METILSAPVDEQIDSFNLECDGINSLLTLKQVHTPHRAHMPMSTTKATPSLSSLAEAHFRQFFTRWNGQSVSNQSKSSSSAAAASNEDSSSGKSRDSLALECWRELHSTMPQLSGHQLEALHAWIDEQLKQPNPCAIQNKVIATLPTLDMAPTKSNNAHTSSAASSITLFQLTPALLASLKSLTQSSSARIAPSSSSANSSDPSSSSSSSSSLGPKRRNVNADAEEVVHESSFHEVMEADAGRASQPLKKPITTGDLEKHSTTVETKVELTPPKELVDAKIHAAANLYTLLTTQLPLTLLTYLTSSSSTSPSSSHRLAEVVDVLSSIPEDLEAERRREANELKQAIQALPVFEFADEPEEIAEEGNHEDANDVTYADDDSDDDFTADALPPDSDDEVHTAWGDLNDLSPSPAEILAADTAALPPATLSSLRARLLTIILHYWDANIFSIQGVLQSSSWDHTLISLWRFAHRRRNDTILLNPFTPTLDGGYSLELLRRAILSNFRLQMINDPSTIPSLFPTLVRDLLGLTYRMTGLSDGQMSEEELAIERHHDQPPALVSYADASRLPLHRTLMSLLTELCDATTTTTFPFSSTSSTPSTSTSALQPVRIHLLEFITHNLPWLAHRLTRFEAKWRTFVESGESMWYAARLREDVMEIRQIIRLMAFYLTESNNSINYASKISLPSKLPNTDAGLLLVQSGIIDRLMHLAILSNHSCFHSPTIHSNAHHRQLLAPHCQQYESDRSSTEIVVEMIVNTDGGIECLFLPYTFPYQPLMMGSHTEGALVMPVIGLPNPFALVHDFILHACQTSTEISRLVYSQTNLMSVIQSSCYEDQHPMPALIIPVLASIRTLHLPMAALTPTANPPVTTTQLTDSTDVSKPKKAKKTKLVVARLDEEDEKETQTLDVDSVKSESAPQSSTPVVSSLSRTHELVNQSIQSLVAFIATNPTASTTNPSADENSHSLSSHSPSPLPYDSIVRLNEFILQLAHFHSITSNPRSSSATAVARIVNLANKRLGSISIDPIRSSEVDLLTQICKAIIDLRPLLPHAMNAIQRQLNDDRAHVSDDSVTDSTQLDDPSDIDDSSVRSLKNRLESSHKMIGAMHQAIKTITLITTKKD